MEFEKEILFIYVDGEKVFNIFVVVVFVLILLILGYLFLNNIGKVFIIRVGNMCF